MTDARYLVSWGVGVGVVWRRHICGSWWDRALAGCCFVGGRAPQPLLSCATRAGIGSRLRLQCSTAFRRGTRRTVAPASFLRKASPPPRSDCKVFGRCTTASPFLAPFVRAERYCR